MIALVLPAAPGLKPPQGQTDPFAEVREAALAALAEALPSCTSVTVIGDRAVADSLLRQAGSSLPVADEPAGDGLVIVCADGSAKRREKAPGHFDPRALDFDEAVADALAKGDADTLRALDPALGEALWCQGVPALRALGELMPHPAHAQLRYQGDPFGVAYWVARWERD